MSIKYPQVIPSIALWPAVNWYLTDTLVSTQSTLDWHLIQWSFEGKLVFVDLLPSVEQVWIETSVDQVSRKMSWSSVDWGSIKGMDQHSTADTLSRHDPRWLTFYFLIILQECSSLHHKNDSDRCHFVNSTKSCEMTDGFIQYIKILYCSFPTDLHPLAYFLMVCS